MRVFFHLHEGEEFAEDRCGSDVASLEEARAEAIADLRFVVGDRIKKGKPLGDPCVKITDAGGHVLETVRWQSAIVYGVPRLPTVAC